MRDILNNHRDFELADEQTIAAHGRVEQENGHPVFRVGYQTYRLVVLPEIYTLDIVTLRLLEKFSQAGGTIISAGALPERVDGTVPTPGSEEERLLAVLRAACVPGKPYETLMPAVERAVKSEVSIRNEKQEEASNIFIRRMNADANCQVIFATNYDEHMRTDAEISIDGGQGSVLHGHRYRAYLVHRFRPEKRRYRLYLSVPPVRLVHAAGHAGGR